MREKEQYPVILKTSNGDYLELNQKQWSDLKVNICIEFIKEEKFEMVFRRDARLDASKMLLDTVAQNKDMGEELRNGYLKTAHELIEQFHHDEMLREQKATGLSQTEERVNPAKNKTK